MTDRYDHDLLLAYLEGDLAPGDRAQVDRMLADDPKLGALMRDLAGDRDLLRSMPSEPAPGDLSFDLVQGLERRMLLDAPQVDRNGGASGPIPISRGRTPGAAGGVRWSRVGGVLGMAAALGLAAGLVIYFNMADPLARTAFEMNDQPAGTPSADGVAQGPAEVAEEAGDLASASTPRSIVGGPAERRADEAELAAADAANLAARAREAILSGGQPDTPFADIPMPGGANLAPHALAEGNDPALGTPGRAGPVTEPVLALTAYAPDRALRIASDNPGLSREQVVAWAVNNGVPVVEPKTLRANADANADPAPQEQLALLIEEDQLESLMQDINEIEVQPTYNQRAELGAVDDAILGYADLQDNTAQADAAESDTAGPGAAAPQDAATAPIEQAPAQPVVNLKVPDDLGDEFLNRQNVANTYQFTNQDELALVAQRDAEVARNRQQLAARPAAREQADPAFAGNEAPGPGGMDAADEAVAAEPEVERPEPIDPAVEPAGQADRAPRNGGANTPSDVAGPPAQAPGAGEERSAIEDGQQEQRAGMREEAEPGAAQSQEDQGEGHTQGAQEGAEDPALRPRTQPHPGAEREAQPTRRGNWLMPQMPLVNSAPVVTDEPTARLVPIVFILERFRPDPAARLNVDEEADSAVDAAEAEAQDGEAEAETAPAQPVAPVEDAHDAPQPPAEE